MSFDRRMKHWYLAYGSNMDPARLQARLGRPCHLAEAVPVVLPGWRCCFDKASGMGHGYATLKPLEVAGYEDARIPNAEGLLWALSSAELGILDDYEGVASGHYQRQEWRIRDTNGESYLAAVYLHCAEFDHPGLLPRQAYLAHLCAGIGRLSRAYGAWLQAHPTWD